MTRSILFFVAIAIFSGCRGDSRGPAVDPFGPTRVPPPGTGAVGLRPATSPHLVSTRGGVAPAFRSPAAAANAGTPTTESAATQSPPDAGSGNKYQPPGGSYDYKGSSIQQPATVAFDRPGDRVAIPVAARQFSKHPSSPTGEIQTSSWPKPVDGESDTSTIMATATSSAVANAGSSANTPGEPERIFRTIEPEPNSPTASSAGRSPDWLQPPSGSNPHRTAGSQEPVDINDLPRAKAADSAELSSNSSGIRLVSAEVPIDGSATSSQSATTSSVASGEFSAKSHYGHAPDYTWLRGRLEYSQIDGKWKLRYIPIDGETDDFGGSVILPSTSMLSGYERGELVEVHGRIGVPGDGDQNYSPEFHVDQIRRISR